jgi:phenylpropionate dioxygenase-like ring-hydroxylating dioxygenase large terminal subunit
MSTKLKSNLVLELRINSSMFICHTNDFSKNKEWRVYPHAKNLSITCNDNSIVAVSNICTHQGSYLSGTTGVGNRQCPYHGWAFSNSGVPIHSGNTIECKNNKPLETQSLFHWNNFMFTSKFDTNGIEEKLNFIQTNKLKLVEFRVDTVKANWNHIVNLFLDVEHIPVVHPGVYERINAPKVSDIDWTYFNEGSLQLVPNIKTENDYNQTLLEDDSFAPASAAWLTIYPYTMIEWQHGAWFITVCNPLSDSFTEVSVYKYRDVRYSDTNWAINEDVWETAWSQDKAQAELLTNSYNKENLDFQKKHFLDWMKNNG